MPVVLADPAANAATVVAQARECHDEGVAVAVFPELCLSGYSIEDLLLQDTLLTAVHDAVATIVEASADLLPVIVVGAPLQHGTRLQVRSTPDSRSDNTFERRITPTIHLSRVELWRIKSPISAARTHR